ncbi:MAG: hypothetical protein ACLGP3_08740 [Acidobacteriota bacterium]
MSGEEFDRATDPEKMVGNPRRDLHLDGEGGETSSPPRLGK